MEIYKDILENLSSGILVISKDGNVMYMNPMAKKILHLYNDLENTTYIESLQNYPELVEMIRNMIETNKTVRRSELTIKQSNFYLKIGYSSMQLKNSKDEHIGYTIIFQDLSIIYDSK